MLKSYLIAFCTVLFSGISLHAQEVLSSQGESYASDNLIMDYTLGEVVIETASSENHTLTQGFHQTSWNFLGQVDHKEDYRATVFPNPSIDQLNIEAYDFQDVSYTLFDANGKLLRQGQLQSQLTELDVRSLTSGHYSLILSSDVERLKTFKLVKLH